MANLDFLKFNAANVAPQTAFDVLPSGDYIAQITESSIKPTKSNTGMMLNTAAPKNQNHEIPMAE